MLDRATGRDDTDRPCRCPYYGCPTWTQYPAFPNHAAMVEHLHDAHGLARTPLAPAPPAPDRLREMRDQLLEMYGVTRDHDGAIADRLPSDRVVPIAEAMYALNRLIAAEEAR